jgi:uncharacterized membrane protein
MLTMLTVMWNLMQSPLIWVPVLTALIVGVRVYVLDRLSR